MAIQAKYYLDNRKNIKKEDIMPFLESASNYVIQNHNNKDTKKSINEDIGNDIEEIEQILLYLCK